MYSSQVLGFINWGKIATAAANLLRHDATQALVLEFEQYIYLVDGFVDDVCYIWLGSVPLLFEFQSRLQKLDPEQIEWTFFDVVASPKTVNFLDLTLAVQQNGKVHTSNYRAPGFFPQYLHFSSFHPIC